MAKKYKVGDVVVLKSGGPEMTIQEVDSDSHVWAQWFGGRKLERGRFPTASIVQVDDSE